MHIHTRPYTSLKALLDIIKMFYTGIQMKITLLSNHISNLFSSNVWFTSDGAL